MNLVEHRLSLDLARSETQHFVNLRNLDSAQGLVITLRNGGEVYTPDPDALAQFVYELPDGTTGDIGGDSSVVISGVQISFVIPSATVAQVGLVECEIRLYKVVNSQTQVLTSSRFVLNVTEVIYDEDTTEELVSDRTLYDKTVALYPQMQSSKTACDTAAAEARAAAGNSVQYVAQTKTEAEQTVARGNIGVTELTNAEISAICVL